MLALRELAGHLKDSNTPSSHQQTLKQLEEAVAKVQSRLNTLQAQGTYMADEYMLAALARWKQQVKYW